MNVDPSARPDSNRTDPGRRSTDMAPGPETLFGPTSVSWRVHTDPVFPVAGVRALILQALHPTAVAGVAQHTGFKDDFWGRLERTGLYVSTLTYGPASEARKLAARIRGIHRRLSAVDPDTGHEFPLDRPDLLLWVHCCEIESFLSTARRAGNPLSAADADAYVAEQVVSAELIGLPGAMVPASVADLDGYFTDIRPQLRLTDTAREGIRTLAIPPMKAWVQLLTPARPAWAVLAGAALATLPRWARRMYRLPALPTTDVAATAALRALRVAALALPEKISGPPEARRARALIAAAEEGAA